MAATTAKFVVISKSQKPNLANKRTTKKPTSSTGRHRGRPKKDQVESRPSGEIIKSKSDQALASRNNYIQTVGRRKTATARLRMTSQGKGVFVVNSKNVENYFPYKLWRERMVQPLSQVGLDGQVDISVKVAGGGLPAQAEAIRLALARVLVLFNPDWRSTLRKMTYLTRDPREKERKKPGLKRARRAPQWQKR